MKQVYLLSFLCLSFIYSSAQYATGGTGKYPDKIFWLRWASGSNGTGLQQYPNMGTYNIDAGGQLPNGNYTWYLNPNIRVVGTLSISTGLLFPGRTDNYWANGLQYLYSGIDPISLNTANGGACTFSISLSLQTRSGTVWTPVLDDNQGIVIADAESFAYYPNPRPDGTPNEHIQATIPNSSEWYLIDVPMNGASGSTLSNSNYVINIENAGATNKRLMMYVNGSAASDKGHASVFYARGLTTLNNIRETGAGVTGLALGFFIPTKPSTAPATYGNAFHLQELMDLGTIEPLSGNNTIASILTSYSGNLPEMNASTITRFDESSLVMPEKYFKDISGLDLEIDISALNLDTKDGKIYAWIDLNGDGIFSEAESVEVIIPQGTTSQTFTVSFPNSMFQGTSFIGNTWLRLRATTDELVNDNEDPSAQDTRSFDYASNGDVIDQPIRITVSTLPVDLISFNAFAKGGYNEIEWVTGNEVNNAGFELMRSRNGIDNWTSVKKIWAENKEDIKNRYKVTDYLAHTPVTFYRLTQTDIDGSTSLSPIISVKNQTEDPGLKVFPIPFYNEIKIELNVRENGKFIVELFTNDGRRVKQKEFVLNKGLRNISLQNLGELPTGTYILKLSNEGKTISSRNIIKQ